MHCGPPLSGSVMKQFAIDDLHTVGIEVPVTRGRPVSQQVSLIQTSSRKNIRRLLSFAYFHHKPAEPKIAYIFSFKIWASIIDIGVFFFSLVMVWCVCLAETNKSFNRNCKGYVTYEINFSHQWTRLICKSSWNYIFAHYSSKNVIPFS